MGRTRSFGGVQMRKGISCIAGATVSLLFAFSGVASADVTLGNVTPPTGSDPGTCFQGPGGNDAFAQLTDDPSAPYTVPAGGGAIGSWETNTAGDAPGTPLTLVILRPTSGGSFTVVGVDNETLPSPLPANNIATFTLSTPIVVQAGDKLALYSSTEDPN